jgi:hypothetical protein
MTIGDHPLTLIIPDVTSDCSTFPETNSAEILRTNLLDELDRMFSGDLRLIAVEGEEAIGRSTLLAQFARRHAPYAISVFIRPNSRITYDPDYIRVDVCHQLHTALGMDPLNLDHVTDTYMLGRFLELQRQARRHKEFVYLVIDGLATLPSTVLGTRDTLLEMLPVEMPNFRSLISGDLEQLKTAIEMMPSAKSFRLVPFTRDETRFYLQGLCENETELKELESLCKGLPGRLSTVRRILMKPTSLADLLAHPQDTLPDLFRIEWKQADLTNDTLTLVLSILAHDRQPHTISQLAVLAGTTHAELAGLLTPLTFLNSDVTSDTVDFVNESFRRFGMSELKAMESRVTELLINYLLDNQETEQALATLPDYLERAGRFDDLVEFLTADRVADVFERSGTLQVVQERVDLGLRTASRLNREADLMRFSIHRSVLEEIASLEAWRSEVEALTALGDYSRALGLAQSAVLKEDALYLLATVAKARLQQGMEADQTLVDQIRAVYREVNPRSLGNRAVEIASELLASCPDLAIELVERSAAQTSAGQELDWAFTQLSVSALILDPEGEQSRRVAKGIRERIKTPDLMELSAKVALMVEASTPESILSRISELPKVSDRLYILRHWTAFNAGQKRALEIVEYAFDLAIQDPTYSPNAQLFRQLAAPLPLADDIERVRPLVRSFSSQLANIERVGPTTEYVRLVVTLAQAESTFDSEGAQQRLLDLYTYVRDRKDLAVRSECSAWLLSGLAAFDGASALESRVGLQAVLESEFNSDKEALLKATADHYQVARQVVEALAWKRFDLAMSVAASLNTEWRRDDALVALLISGLRVPNRELNLRSVRTIIEAIADPEKRADALDQVLERLSHVEQSQPHLSKEFPALLEHLQGMSGSIERAGALARAYRFLFQQRDGTLDQLGPNLLKWLDEAWESLDPGWHKVDVGFDVARQLALAKPEIAWAYVERVGKLRSEAGEQLAVPSFALVMSLYLATRSLSGLLRHRRGHEEALRRLAAIIERLPAVGEKARLYAEVALRCHEQDCAQDCRRIVLERLMPLIHSLDRRDERYYSHAVISAAPAIFAVNSTLAFDLIGKLPIHYRDPAYERICEAILRKRPPGDPYEYSNGQGYELEYADIVQILEIVARVDCDSTAYRYVATVADSVVEHGERITREMRTALVEKLERLVDTKFPAARFITHGGFKVVARCQVYRIQGAPRSQWVGLAEEARGIPNEADAAYVLAIIAGALPRRESGYRDELTLEALHRIQQLPATYDKMERYESLAADVYRFNKAVAKKCVEAAMEIALKADGSDVERPQRRLVDLAYRIDPDFASSLASLGDDDPAKIGVRNGIRDVRKRLHVLELGKKLGDRTGEGKALEMDMRDPNLPQAAWLRLGALNAGLAAPLTTYQVTKYLQGSAMFPLSEAFPILSLIVESIVSRIGNPNQVTTHLLPLFEATMLNAELAERVAVRSAARADCAKRFHASRDQPRSVPIGPGERDKAMDVIRNWAASTVGEYVKICDPFFGLEQLGILRLIQLAKPGCKIYVLTSKNHQDQEVVQHPRDEAYRDYWRFRIAHEDPPEGEIVIASVGKGASPIHDRWILTAGGGLRLGTSLNSIGINKESEISFLSGDEAEALEQRLDQYLIHRKRMHENERVTYSPIVL